MRRIAGLYLLVALESFFSPLLLLLPLDTRGAYAAVLLTILGLTLFGAGRLNQTAEELLPPVEDRVLYRLKPSVTSLRAYVREWQESEGKSAVKALRRVANILDVWSVGNLKFLKDEVGTQLADFKKNFRGRVLLAVEKADKARIPDLLTWLTNFQNALETDTMNKVSLETWTQFLSQPSPKNSAEPMFPYQAPPKDILSRLMSQWFQMLTGLSLPIVPIATGLVEFYILHTTIGEASIVAATVFTGMAALAYLVFNKQKGNSRV